MITKQKISRNQKQSKLHGEHHIFGYVTVLKQKLYLENCLCVLVNIKIPFYIEIPKIIIQREPNRVQLDI